jgi:Lrp/AsnC family transcriptional regulator, leucine-responsive regulatory protein
MDDVDRTLLGRLQHDATQAYAALGQAVGLSAAAAHERVRKLRASGVIQRTTVTVDPDSVGLGVLAFVLVDADSWMGEAQDAFAAIPEIEEAHVIAGPASMLLKVRTSDTPSLQRVLRQIFDIEGVTGTNTIVVLETAFTRPINLPQ